MDGISSQAVGGEWTQYLGSPSQCDPLSIPGLQLSQHLSSHSDSLFYPDSIDVRLVDIDRNEAGVPVCCSRVFIESMKLVSAIIDDKKPRIRIISIHSRVSVRPLRITEELMQMILSHYNVWPEFIHTLLSSGKVPHFAEEGSSFASARTSENGYQISYQFQYVEDNGRPVASRWSLRHTGIYHHHDVSANFDLWIILHPVNGSILENKLTALADDEGVSRSMRSKLYQDPFRLHLLIYSSYSDNWRWYLRFLGDQVKHKNEMVFTLELSGATSSAPRFEAVRSLRSISDTIISSSAYCNGNIAILNCLEKTGDSSELYRSFYATSREKVRGYAAGFGVVDRRISNAIDFLSYALHLKNQNDSAETNRIVKNITIVSLIYLPGSFLGTVYGTNFFLFEPETMTITIARNFWIFVATWIPLTLLTVAAFKYRSRTINFFTNS